MSFIPEGSFAPSAAGKSRHGVFIKNDGRKLMSYAGQSIMGEDMAKVIAAAMAVVEWNASMGKIVAAPTAEAIGCIIAKNAYIAGAMGGCQAETGSGAAMAAGALTELLGRRGGNGPECGGNCP